MYPIPRPLVNLDKSNKFCSDFLSYIIAQMKPMCYTKNTYFVKKFFNLKITENYIIHEEVVIMADNPLGGLGDLFGGGLGKALSGFMPQDAPESKLLKASTDLAELQKQEKETLAEIGKQAFEQNPDMWPQADKLRLVRSNIADAQKTLNEAQRAQEEADAAKASADAVGRCPSCGNRNPEGVKFCQECGSKLGASFCNSCGAELAPNIRFCGACGANQEG